MFKLHRTRSETSYPFQRHPHWHRLRLEPLEDRRMLSVVVVDTEQDVIDFNDGVTSLREAIFATNTVPGADEIVFDFGHDGPATIRLEHGEFEITEALVISGDGPELLTIDAQQNSRIFNITATTGDFAIVGMTVTGGKTTGDNLDWDDTTFSGGAIRSLTGGMLMIENCDISDSLTTGQRTNGGGVFAVSDVTVNTSTISGNLVGRRSSSGGGIHGCNVTVTSCTISGNSADWGSGGGICARVNVTVISSTMSANSAWSSGGIYGGTVTVISSTISENSTGGLEGSGGGIHGGAVTVTSSTISGNSAKSGKGGGISGDNVTVTSSTISGNLACCTGGGIYGGTVRVTSSTISGNLAGGGGGIYSNYTVIISSIISDNSAIMGGGIWSDTVKVTSTTISGNSAEESSGGIFANGDITVTSSTISGNSVYWGVGGGIFGYGKNVTVTSSTITDNQATIGGGIWTPRNTTTVFLSHTIVAGNIKVTDTNFSEADDLAGSGTFELGYSLVGTAVGAINTTPGTINYFGVDPLLGPLQDNGGPTWTHALLPGSPAIDAGDPLALAGVGDVPELDQRGEPYTRVADGNGDGTTRIDIGAFEVPDTFVIDTMIDESDGDFSLGDFSLREAIERANALPSYNNIVFASVLFPSSQSLLLTLGEMEITAVLTLTGPGRDLLTIDAQQNSRIFNITATTGDFTIAGMMLTGGKTTGNNMHYEDTTFSGGAIRSVTVGRLTIENCHISGNSTTGSRTNGGGIFTEGNVTINSSTVSGNLVDSGRKSGCRGGGIFGENVFVTSSTISENITTGYFSSGSGIFARGYLSIISSTISDNSAIGDHGGSSGGGIYGDTVSVTSSTISDNSAISDYGGSSGGGIHGDTVSVTSSTISGNSAYWGGGIDGQNVTVTSTTVSRNSANWGGGISGHNVTVTSSTISGNDGGGISGSTVTVTSCTISGNSGVYGSGGGISGVNVTVTNSTVAINISGGIDGYGTLNNTIVSGNSGPDISGTLSGSHNLIGDGSGQSDLVDGVDGNQVGTASSPIDPLLSDLSQFDNGVWGYYLLPGSPALDSGDNTLAVNLMGQPLTEDVAGNARIQNGTVDIGAIEGVTSGSPSQSYLVTSLEKTIAEDGALTFIEAFEAANRNRPMGDAPAGSFIQQDTIHFAEGVNGTVLLDNGELAIAGDLSIEGPGAELLVFDAGSQNRVFSIYPHVSVDLCGITVTGGEGNYGGGIYNQGMIKVSNSAISGNSAGFGGGGIYNSFEGVLTVTNTTIVGNSSNWGSGGGIYNSGTVTVINTTIVGNLADYGGGIFNNSGTLTIHNSIIAMNEASSDSDLAIWGGVSVRSEFNLVGVNLHFVRNQNPGVDETWCTADDDYGDLRLTEESPAIDMGNNDLVPYELVMDQDGNTRIYGALVDIGAYEFQGAPSEGREMPSTLVTTEQDVFNLYDGEISLREAVWYTVAGDCVTFDDVLDQEDIMLSGTPIFIDRQVTIDASMLESLVINAGMKSRVMLVLANEVELIGLTITGGVASSNGGGIYSVTTGNLVIQNSIISGNSTMGNFAKGGGIFAGGKVTVISSVISENSATSYGEYNASGGGIFGDTVIIDSSMISGNSVCTYEDDYRASGGGISGKNVTVASSTISGNWVSCGTWAHSSGGGIYGNNVTVTYSTISDNSAIGDYGGSSGGGISGDNVTVTSSAISRNSAKYGGGIAGDNVMVTSSTISENSVEGMFCEGGGIAGGNITVTLSTILGNSASGGNNGNGGGIYGSNVTVISSTISGNSASGRGSSGGGISGDNVTVTNSIITGNLTSTGGGISNWGTLKVTNSTIVGNVGGGIYSTEILMALNNTIVASNYGPDIYISSGTLSGSHNLIGDGSGQSDLVDGVDGNQVGTTTSPIDPLLSDLSQFENGLWGYYLLPGSRALDAGDNALAVNPMGEPLTEDVAGNVRIQNGTVDIGAIEGVTSGSPSQSYLVTSLEKTIAEDGALTFIEAFEAANRNRPMGDAPAGSFIQQDTIHFSDGLSGTVLLDDGELVIVGDLSIEGPGAELLVFDAGSQNRVFSIYPQVNVDLCGMTITGGEADDGGGIWNAGKLTVSNSTVTANSADWDSGGGVYSTGILTITNSTIAQNRSNGVFSTGTLIVINSTIAESSRKGINNTGIMTIMNSTIQENRSSGIYNTGTMTVVDSTLRGNAASYGGGIYNEGTLTVSDSTIASNSARYGGGIQNTGILTVSNSVVVDNAASYGGGIYNEGTLTVSNVMVASNSASSGGGIRNDGTLTITNSTISYNDDTGIYNDGTLAVSNSIVSSNSAFFGGGIWNPGTLVVSNSNISDNSASSFGGGIYNEGTLTISNSNISGNSANINGGGISNCEGAWTVSNSTITNNVAESGGGIYNYCYYHYCNSFKIINSTIANNSAIDCGGGIWSGINTLTLTNSIVTLNIALNDSNLNGSFDYGTGYNLVGTDPGFILNPSTGDDGIWGTDDDVVGDLHLSHGSPAINAGNNTLAVDAQGNPLTTDLDGKQRIIYGTVDIGAYEYGFVADADIDGDVDGQDLNAWKNGFGIQTGAIFSDGDADADGDVDGNDFLAWQLNFGENTSSATAAKSPSRLTATDDGSGAFLSTTNAPADSTNNAKGDPADLVRSIAGNGQNASFLPADRQGISFDAVDYAGWSMPQLMPKTNGNTKALFGLPQFQSREASRPFQRDRAVDAVMSRLDEQVSRTDLMHLHHKVRDITTFTDSTTSRDEMGMAYRAGKTSIREITSPSRTVEDRADLETALEELTIKQVFKSRGLIRV